ncbi:MAG: phosphotransferase family protein [Caldilineaceae bacterium]
MVADAHAADDIADRLIAYLQAEAGYSGSGYIVPPTTLTGGFETRLYRFQLAGAGQELSIPLVLRIFPPAQPAQRAVWECSVQNCIAEQGYPAPRVLFTGTDPAIFGGSFLVMQYAPGDTLLVAEPDRTPEILGAAHALLHQIDPAPLIDALHSRGFDRKRFGFESRLAWLYGMRDRYPWLSAVLQWLMDSAPPEPHRLSICHGDFHPLNILVQEGDISAVLDWSGFSIADPVMDVAFTMVILSVAASMLLPQESSEKLLSRYRTAYEQVHALDAVNLDYYRTLRCVMALVEGAEGQEVWTRPPVLVQLTDIVSSNTGVSVHHPQL